MPRLAPKNVVECSDSDSETSTSDNTTPDLQLVEYSEKSFVLLGDTIDHASNITKLGGTYNTRLKCGPGWIFSNTRKESVKKYLDTGKVEPYVYTKEDKNKYAKNLETSKIFKDLINAFDSDCEYSGESIIDAIKQVQKKYKY